MVIELYTEELRNRLKATSHYEVAEIADPEARYRAEAGSEKDDEINVCLVAAIARLQGRLRQYLKHRYDTSSDNLIGLPDVYSFDLVLSERRAVNKAEALAEAMNTFVVEYALSRFYSTVSQGELSNKHSLLAVDSANLLDDLLHSKLPPIA